MIFHELPDIILAFLRYCRKKDGLFSSRYAQSSLNRALAGDNLIIG
jgi:hypothetical protein